MLVGKFPENGKFIFHKFPPISQGHLQGEVVLSQDQAAGGSPDPTCPYPACAVTALHINQPLFRVRSFLPVWSNGET